MSDSRLLIFEIYRDGAHERTERLQQDVVKIGSHAKSHLFLDDANVSRVHAVVEVTGDDVFVIDLGSGKGTTVGGQRVNKQKLAHGDRIGVGGYELVIRFHEVGQRSGAGAAGGASAPVAETDDEAYTRRFLQRPENSDGSVEAAMLFRDLVIADDLYQPPTTLKVGSGADCQFQVESDLIPGGEMVLLDASGGQPALLLREAMTGEIWVGDSHFSPAEAISSGRATPSGGAWKLPLTNETRARLALGDLVFFFRRSEVPKFVFPIKRDWRAAGLALAVSAAIQGGLILVSLLMPPEVGELAMERDAQLNRYVQMLLVKPEEKKPEEKPEWLKEKQAADKKSDAKGAAKADKSKPEETKTQDKPEEVTELARAEARDEAMNRGAVDVLNQLGPSNVFGGDAAAGVAELEAIGGVSDTGLGQSYGQGGLGKFGGGLSGGGGRLATGVGGGPIGVGRSGGSNVGGNLRSVSDRKARTPVVSSQPFSLTGALDMDIVRRVITEHRREIIACYETELQKLPELQGRIDVEFVIGPDGAVGGTKLKASTLNNTTVETCVQRRVKQWRFPEPKGGGTVRVSYPWIFTSGG